MIPTNQQGSFNESTLFDRKAVSKQQGMFVEHTLLVRKKASLSNRSRQAACQATPEWI